MEEKRVVLFFSFLLIGIGLFYSVLANIIESPYFTSWVKTKISSSIKSDKIQRIDFSSIELSGFPFKIKFKDFEFQAKVTDIDSLKISSKSLEASLGFFTNRYDEDLSLSLVSLEDGVVVIPEIKKSKEEKPLDLKVEKILKDLTNGLKVNDDIYLYGAELKNILIRLGEKKEVYVEQGEFESRKERFHINVVAKDLYYSDKISANLLKIEAKLDKKNLSIKKILAKKDFSYLKLDGLVNNIASKDPSLKLNATSEFIAEEVIPSEIIKDHGLSGLIKMSSKIIGSLENPDISGGLVLNKFLSKYSNVEKGLIDYRYSNHSLFLDKAILNNSGHEVFFNESQLIFKKSEKGVFPKGLNLSLKKVPLYQALKVIPTVESKLKGLVSGKIKLTIPEGKVLVEIIDSVFYDLALDVDGEILKFKKISLNNGLFSYNNSNERLDLSALINQAGSPAKVVGHISPDEVSIKSPSTKVNFNDVYHILDFPVLGSSEFDINVSGTVEKTKISMKGNSKEFNFAEFALGEVQSKILINLGENTIAFNDLKGRLGTGRYSGRALVDMESLDVDGKFNFVDFSIEDIKKSHYPVITSIPKYYWDYTKGKVRGVYNISGKVDLPLLEIKGKVKSDNLSFFLQDFTYSEIDFVFSDMNLKMNRILGSNGSAKVLGSMNYIDSLDELSFNFSSTNYTTNDLSFYRYLNPGFSSNLSFTLKGIMDKNQEKFNFDLKLLNSKMLMEKFPSSKMKIDYLNGEYLVDSSFGNDLLELKGKVFDEGIPSSSELNFKVDIDKWHYVFNLFSTYDLNHPYLKGECKADLFLNFNLEQFESLTLDGDIRSFSFDHEEIDLKISKPKKVLIENGFIKNWDLAFTSLDKTILTSKGSGHISTGYEISTKGEIESLKLSKIMDSFIDFNGPLSLKHILKGKKQKVQSNLKLKSSRFNLGNISWPDGIKQGEFDVELDNNFFKIKKFKSKFGDGHFSMNGSANISSNPKMNIKYEFDQAKININEQSYVFLNGKGSAISKKPPFIINGVLEIEGGKVLDEFEKFIENEEGFTTQGVKFLPENKEEKEKSWFEMNIDTKLSKPLFVKNSIVEKQLYGKLRVLGPLTDFKLQGDIYTRRQDENFIFLNNNEILTKKLSIRFDDESDFTNPNIEYEGESLISDYKLGISSYGEVENLSFEFNSEPFLERSSILSLLAFGYADESANQDLTDDQREGLASAGVGSFLFNQLKINETLKKTLGLTLNVNTKVLDSNTSYLSGRVQGSGAPGSNVRTATNVKLSRKITDKMNIDLSSTVLGDSGQTTKVDIDYKISDKVLLEGVYENTLDENQTGAAPTQSFGADVKFRWTFK